QRAWAIERVERNQVVETARLRLAQQLAHPRALELEDAECRPLSEHLVGLRVVERDAVDVEIDPLGPLDLLEAVVNERQRAQAEEIHLQEADALDLLHIPLRRQLVALPFVKRRIVG